MKDFKVYCHTLFDGRKYIGITSQPLNRRWRNGDGYKTKDGYFYRAIQKYGWNAFTHEILAEGLTEEDAKDLEKKLIAKYKTQDRNYGFNISGGGDGIFNPSEETRKKIGEWSRQFQSGRKQSAETKKKHSDWLKEHNPNKDGKCLTPERITNFIQMAKKPKTEEQKKKMSNSAKKHAVICVETGEIYQSMKEASASKNICYTSLTSAIYDSHRKAGGYHWNTYEG